MEKHNGWSNIFTWQVFNWMSNDHSEELFRGWAQHLPVNRLADGMREYYEDNAPLQGDATMYADLLSHALAFVNWDEIAAHFYEE